jgi:hypothetical protein
MCRGLHLWSATQGIPNLVAAVVWCFLQRAASDILLEEAGLQSQLFLVFLSDGAPSDHADMECDHGICVWQPDGTGMIRPNGKDQLHSCGYTTVQTCRQQLRQRVETECVRIIRNLGDMLGRDRVQIHTVAFGPETENYAVLQNMAAALPRSSFQVGNKACH